MKSFQEFLKEQQMMGNNDSSPQIMQAATQISKKNKNAIIGATNPQELSNIMKDKSAADLVRTDPKNAGKLGQIFTGLDAKDLEKQKM